MWLGHYNPIITMAAATLTLVSDLFGNPALFQLVLTPAWTLALVSMLAFWYHIQRPCLRCVDESPLTTSDPGAVVKRRDRELKVFHSRMMLIGLSVFLVVATGVEAIGGFMGRPLTASVWGLALDVIVELVFAYNAFVFLVHRRLAQWCPYCRDEGGGWGDEEPPTGPPGPQGGRKVNRTGVVRLR